MNRSIVFFTALAMACAAGCGAALADVEYRCLNACIAGGKDSRSCLQTCGYQTRQVTVPTVAKSSPNNAFAPLQPYRGIILPGPAAAQNTPASSRVVRPGGTQSCITDCVRTGQMPAYCRSQCGG